MQASQSEDSNDEKTIHREKGVKRWQSWLVVHSLADTGTVDSMEDSSDQQQRESKGNQEEIEVQSISRYPEERLGMARFQGTVEDWMNFIERSSKVGTVHCSKRPNPLTQVLRKPMTFAF